MFSRLLFLVIVCSVALPVLAEAQVDETENLEVIEVVNNHSFNSPNYQILQRDSFVHSAQTLADILQTVNGIQIRQISGIGNPVSVSIRGSSSKQVQLYIDGQLINDSQFGGFDLNQIPTEQIQSIEISKNQAIGTGATPIGGVIRINTYSPTEDTSKLTFAAGSFGYQELNLLHNKAFKAHSLSFGGNYVGSDNDYEFLLPQSFDHGSTAQPQVLRNNEFSKKTLFINDTLQLGQHQLRLNIQYNKQDKSLPDYQFNSPQNFDKLSSDSLRYSYQHLWLSNTAWLDSIELELYAEDKDERYLSSPDAVRIDINDYTTLKQHAGVKPLFTWQAINLSPFIRFNKQKFTSVSQQNGQATQCNGIGACDILAKQKQLSLGTRLEWQPSYLPIEAYLLFSHLSEKNINIALNHQGALKYQADNNYQTKELGLSYNHGNFKISTNFSDGVRTPTLYELFGDRGAFKGNDNLLPEAAKTLSIGGQYNSEKLSISTAFYQQQLKNSIVAIFNSSNVGSYSNVSDADLRGFEFQANYQLLEPLSISLQSNLIDSETSSAFVAFDQKKLPGIYHQQYSIALKYQLTQAWQISFKTSQDKELYFNLINKFQNNHSNVGNGNPADRTIADLSLYWQHDRHRLSISANNLFNEKYQDLANRTAQGRSLKIKYTIEGL